MKISLIHTSHHRSESGIALVIVLIFLVLLIGLVLAFFSRSQTAVKSSDSSAQQTKAGLLADSATSLILSDLKQEIFDPNASTVVALSSGENLYVPKTPSNAVPLRSGNPAPVGGIDPIPNLIRMSVRTDSIASPGRPSQASAVNSTTDPSKDGRFITKARWNSHYLIPRFNAGASADSTPDSTTNFTSPDWVFVTRSGRAVQSGIGTGPSALSNRIPSNANYVIGRYAYAIYDEGGLMDMNVAGYPAPGAPPSTSGFTTTQASQKLSLALADLTQLPIVKNASNYPIDYLPQSAIDKFVGWRNMASAQLTGSFPSFSFGPGSLSNWYNNFARGNTNGYRTVYGAASGNTDQALLSRQQLIKLSSAIGLDRNALQFMGTFNRSLDQPSFVPDLSFVNVTHARPRIVGSSTPPDTSAISTYSGNNTYFGGESAINMAGAAGFLSVRVANTFTRLDGSTAVAGEPLVNRKFALSRLQLVTTTATAVKTKGDPIYDRFGLSRSNASSPWVYDHGIAAGGGASSASSPAIIATLAQVAALSGANAREPDFAELLKAAINAGSVGKGGPSGQGQNDQYRIDVSGDLQILQICANLIDQQKTDNFPTWIQYTQNFGAAKFTRNIYGAQDLPYFYRWHFFGVTTQTPTPLLKVGDTVDVINSSGLALQLTHAQIQGSTVLQPGSASYMIIPQIWNPHDANTPVAASRPTNFRVVAETNDPGNLTTPYKISAQPQTLYGYSGRSPWGTTLGYHDADPPQMTAWSTPTALNSANASLYFTDTTNGRGFREPTLLWRDGFPAQLSGLGNYSATEDPLLGTHTYYGILVGQTPVAWISNVMIGSATGVPTTPVICETTALGKAPDQGTGSAITGNMTFRMQYKDASNNWITYQEVYVGTSIYAGYSGWSLYVNPADYSSNNNHRNPLAYHGGVDQGDDGPTLTPPMNGPYDPRSGRFSTPIFGQFTDDDKNSNGNPTLDAVTQDKNANPSPAANALLASSNFVLMATQRPANSRGQSNWYKTPCDINSNSLMGWFSSFRLDNSSPQVADAHFYDGLISQNNPAVRLLGRDNSTQQSQYYADADGVCRRAMGGYTPTSGNASGRLTNTTSIVGLPMATATNTFANGLGSPTSQTQSRPILLHRPFRNVAEMSYAFRGTPWKNIDFFTPESGDTALLDVFCITEPPTDAIVAGKVNLNTRQAPVLQAILAGAYKDEWSSLTSAPTSGVLPALTSTEAQNVANKLISITTASDPWRGPLTNVADLVGHYVPSPGAVSGNDVYQYTNPASGQTYTYAGLSAALDSTLYSNASTPLIQRFRESAIRPLAAVGQTRVWNLLIDVIAQTGRYPGSAVALKDFVVEGEKRYWIHVAIDRYTGQVLDRQLELVTE